MAVAINPFDPKTVLLAKHAQHVVLVHFPIALLITAVGFDFAGEWWKKPLLSTVARCNLAVAALATIPVVGTGLLAWQWQLEGHKLKGILLQHLVMGLVSTALIWLVWWMHIRMKSSSLRMPVELLTALAVAVTAHLGGFLSGVNAPG
ncbi:MAG TPA: DUF2231 domain-containing protein [Candidatus Bathyarchaeia archaeon]|nr:DUF2231 domain-containing protein [Candidatus Bathyarchaeia archaeon]